MGTRSHGKKTGTARLRRQDIAKNTMKILDRGFYEVLVKDDEREEKKAKVVSIAQEQVFAVANTILYKPKQAVGDRHLGEKKERDGNPVNTTFQVTALTTLDAVRKLVEADAGVPTDNKKGSSCCCLNFASAKNPGGGFLSGAQAQEESIARASGLGPCLDQKSTMEGYYQPNRKARAPFYTDTIIYSPDVPVFKHEDGSGMETPILVSFVTAPAVNAREAKKKAGWKNSNQDLVETTMRRRIRKVLEIAEHHGHDTLVLGAWGCGVFGNDPRDIARWFSEELKAFPSPFEKVIFAIYAKSDDDVNLRAFRAQFLPRPRRDPRPRRG